MAFASPVTFRVGPLEVEFNRRGRSTGALAKRDLLRYYMLLSLLQRSVPTLNEQERDKLIAVIDAIKPYAPGMFLPIPDPELAKRINGLTVEQQLALVDWLEQLHFSRDRAADLGGLDEIDA